jgi:hypothetical protein
MLAVKVVIMMLGAIRTEVAKYCWGMGTYRLIFQPPIALKTLKMRRQWQKVATNSTVNTQVL